MLYDSIADQANHFSDLKVQIHEMHNIMHSATLLIKVL